MIFQPEGEVVIERGFEYALPAVDRIAELIAAETDEAKIALMKTWIVLVDSGEYP